MSKNTEFKNRDRFIELGLTIAAVRKMKGFSQEQLAEKAGISRSHLSSIEAPNIVRPFSVEVLYNIADALDMRAGDLLNTKFPFSEWFPNRKEIVFMGVKNAVVERFKNICNDRNIKANELAVISGVTPSSVYSMYDNRRQNISIVLIKKLCDGLEISLADFFNSDEFNNLEQEIK